MWLSIITGAFFTLGLILLVGGIYLFYSLFKIVRDEGFWLPGIFFLGGYGLFGVLVGAAFILRSMQFF